MAIVNDNELTSQLRGRVGRYLVFRNIRGRIIASRAPRKPDPRKQSAAQRQTRVTFRDAAAWAVRTMQNPYEKQRYQELAKKRGLTNAYTAAVQHYMQRSSTKGKRVVQSQQKLTKSAKAETIKFCNDDEGLRFFRSHETASQLQGALALVVRKWMWVGRNTNCDYDLAVSQS